MQHTTLTDPAQLRLALLSLYAEPGGMLPDSAARLRLYGDAFMDALAKDGYLQTSLSCGEMFWLPQCVPLHDLGVLTGEREIKRIPARGLDLLRRIDLNWGVRPFSAVLRDIVEGYRARWDGAGCSGGAAGEEIPIAARVAAIIGAYAQEVPLGGPYRRSRHYAAIDLIYSAGGLSFDPRLVELFAGAAKQLLRISEGFVGQDEFARACA